MNPDNVRIAIIGFGYVGLPLAVEFGKHFPTIGFDLKQGPHRRASRRPGQHARNDGDKEHRLTTIKKITSGSTSEAAAFVDTLYRRIIEPAPARPPVSALPKPPRSSKTPSAT
ncbi:hypothetical protein ABZN20_05535 [Methylococcus sp. ANG]|uniref:hypothetical protein n=1 Tax=Methylococcus sp. ANG TaxID=3231903 RepID=UPI003459AFCC